MNIFVSVIHFFFLVRTGEAFAFSEATSSLLPPPPFRRIGITRCNPLRASSPSPSSDDDIGEIQRIVGLTDAELKRIVSRVPELNNYAPSETEACVKQLKERLSLSEIEFKKKIVLRLPQCLGYDFGTDIGPFLNELQEFLDMSDDELRSLVLKCPQIIGLDFSTEVQPKINALRGAIGGDDDNDAASLLVVKDEILKKPASLDLAVRGGVSPSKKKRS